MARATQTRRSPGRPAGGSDALVRAVLDTTLKRLQKVGYADLAVEDIATAAGVNKTTIYRRWPTKGDLVLAAISTARGAQPRFEETGDLRADLHALLERKAKGLSTPTGRLVANALMSIPTESEIGARLRAMRFGLPSGMIQRALERGELAPDVDPELAAELFVAPLVHRIVILGEAATPEFLAKVVDHTLAGLGHRPKGKKQP